MIPLRYIFRSRWAALAWAAGICWSAAQFADSDKSKLAVDAANAADGNAAQQSALAAELQ
jgi:hypothetical protein